MVLKKSKFGSNTGNTLRRVGGCSTKGQVRVTKTAHFITKEYNKCYDKYYRLDPSDPIRHEDSWLENRIRDKHHPNGINSSENVKYSLNKHGGWLLPTRIKKEIEDKALLENHEEKMILKKRRKKKREAVCETRPSDTIGLNVFEGRPYIVYVEGTLNIVSSRGKEVYVRSNDPTKKQLPSWRHSHPHVYGDYHITYEVEQPARENWYYHTEAKAKQYNVKGRYHQEKKQSKKRKRFIYDENELYYSEEEDEEGEDELRSAWNEFSSYFESQLYSLDSFDNSTIADDNCNHYEFCNIDDEIKGEHDGELIEIEEANIDNKCFEVINTPLINDTKVISCAEVDSTKVSVVDSNEYPYIKKFHGFVNNKHMTKNTLRIYFGPRYTEVQCSPRRIFVFDKRFLRSGRFVSIHAIHEGLHFTEVDIFIYDEIKDENIDLNNIIQHGIIDVHLLITTYFNQSDSTTCSNDVIPIGEFSRSHKRDIDMFYRTFTDVITMEDVWFSILQNTKHYSTPQNVENISESFCPTLVCQVCYTTEHLTHMKSCAHFLCNECWTQYIKNKLSLSLSILCPEQHCQQVMGPAMILSYLDYTDAISFMKSYIKFHVQRTPSLKMCPSDDCTKVASYQADGLCSSSAVPLVNCHRKYWCFNCDREDHWPLSCKINESYLIEKTDIMSTHSWKGEPFEQFISYKVCPSCKSAIQIDRGCSHMTCYCGAQFCWGCLTSLDEQNIDHNLICKHKREKKIYMTKLGYSSTKVKARMIYRANDYQNMLKTIKMKQKWLRKTPKEDQSYKFGIYQKASYLIRDCYRLLLNLSVKTAFTNSRHARSRIMKFMDRLEGLVIILRKSIEYCDDSIEVYHAANVVYLASNSTFCKLRRLNVGKVNRNMVAVNDILNEMKSFLIDE